MNYTIPYQDLDVELIELIDLLNYKLNYKTKFSCFGHNNEDHLYIMFDDSVSFNDFEPFAERIADNFNCKHLTCKYWVRKGLKRTLKNWMIETNGKQSFDTRIEILNKLTELIKNR
jgi:hypothetical protein